ncbi:MAG: IS701 family transposase [Firmicutes bacterium]|nr:IS701 family transposase [Bacillota bacterium]
MSAPIIVPRDKRLVKFFMAIGLQVILSKPQIAYFLYIVAGIIGGNGRLTISNIHRATTVPRAISNTTRFLGQSPWDDTLVNRYRKEYVVERFQRQVRPGTVGFFMIDDTTMAKDKDTRHIEGLDFHFSHLDGKTVWSHQVVSSHCKIGDFSLPMDYSIYLREEYCEKHGLEFKSKIDIAIEQINDFKALPGVRTYLLLDKWYTCQKVIEAGWSRGMHTIGATKTNRIIYPKGIRISIADFAKHIRKRDLDTVTVDGKRYDVYRHEGKAGKIDNAVVLMCWEGGYDKQDGPFCILCTDVELESGKVIAYYSERWDIETGYRYFKDRLGFDHYQVRSLRAIQRFWCAVFMAYTYLELYRVENKGRFRNLGEAIDAYRQGNARRVAKFVYEAALNGQSLTSIYRSLGLAA